MIVDVHTHTPSHVDTVPSGESREFSGWHNGPPARLTNSWADYAAGTSPADVTIVFNIAVDRPGTDTASVFDPARVNTATAEFAASDPGRRIGFMSVNPNHSDFLDEVERGLELGLVGIKLAANYQQFEPLGLPARHLYRFAQQRGLPILFHQGASPISSAPLRYAHPLVTDEVAAEFPELRIVMAHLGHPWTRETVVTVRKHPHVYADISAVHTRPSVLYEGLLQATEWGVIDRLLFGSDFPATTTAEAIDGLRNVNSIVEGTGFPRISAEAIESIIHADALAALGLARPAAEHQH